MIKFEKKDKNGILRNIHIDYGYYLTDTVYLQIIEYGLKQSKISKFFSSEFRTDKKYQNKTLYSETKDIKDLTHFTCVQYEQWADEAMIEFNKRLTNQEEKERILKIIENGCC